MSKNSPTIIRKRKNIQISQKKRFKIDDDKKLIYLVEKYHENWDLIGFLMNRQKRVCKERYYHYLVPKHSSWQWTTEERLQLIYLKTKLNYNWEEINKIFPSRGPKTIKNQWYYLSKKPNVKELITYFQTAQSVKLKETVENNNDENKNFNIFSDLFDSSDDISLELFE